MLSSVCSKLGKSSEATLMTDTVSARPGVSLPRSHTHYCNSMFMRTFIYIIHYPAPYPDHNYPN